MRPCIKGCCPIEWNSAGGGLPPNPANPNAPSSAYDPATGVTTHVWNTATGTWTPSVADHPHSIVARVERPEVSLPAALTAVPALVDTATLVVVNPSSTKPMNYFVIYGNNHGYASITWTPTGLGQIVGFRRELRVTGMTITSGSHVHQDLWDSATGTTSQYVEVDDPLHVTNIGTIPPGATATFQVQEWQRIYPPAAGATVTAVSAAVTVLSIDFLGVVA
ncbi:MAG: hypothetical protein ACRCW4_14140 [Candidatus Neomicrothrix subdominans]